VTFNFCPFRPPDWASLPNAAESFKFSQQTCEKVLDVVEPPAIVCNGINVAGELDLIPQARGRVIEGPVSRPIGWKTPVGVQPARASPFAGGGSKTPHGGAVSAPRTQRQRASVKLQRPSSRLSRIRIGTPKRVNDDS
jgi:hypothetical protein